MKSRGEAFLFFRLLWTELPAIHLNCCAMHKAIQWAPGEALGDSAPDHALHDERIDKGVVCDAHGEFCTLLLFALLHVVKDLVLQPGAICREFCVIHAVPTLGRIWAGALADGNGMVKFKDSVISIPRGLSLGAAGIHGITFHAFQVIICIVVSFMKDSGSWSKLELLWIGLFWSLPVVGAKLEDQCRHCRGGCQS